MKNIVLYLMATCLITFTEMTGQKPTIELLPSTHQRVNPEAGIDTSHSKDSVGRIVPNENFSVTLSGDPGNKKMIRKESRKKWFRLDSIFQKETLKSSRNDQWSERFTLIIFNVNPIKLFIHITALKI